VRSGAQWPTWCVIAVLGATAGATQADPLAARSKGRADAPVVVYEMADFQCPACRMFALRTMPQIEQEYIATGKVRWVFVHYPLTSIHANAAAAAELATCAARQRKFWALHDLLYAHQDEWAELPEPTSYFLTLADSARLDRAQLVSCVQSNSARTEVEGDAGRAVRSGAHSTPTFYIEGGLLSGAAPIDVFRQVLDSIYRSKRPALPRG
jgi:protein-disulfide isomerase